MNELNRMRKLAGMLTEGVMSVPGVGGSESDMQTATTNGVNSADAAFDSSQSMSIDEMFDKLSEELDPSEESLIHKYMAGELSREEFMQEMDRIAATDHSMRQGEMGMQGSDTPQGHRAWDREQDDWAGMDDQEDEYDELDMEIEETAPMDEDGSKEVIQQKLARAQELKDSMVEPDEVSNMIANELEQEGYSPDDIEDILNAIADEMTDVESDFGDGICSACQGTGEGRYEGSSCHSCGGSGEDRGEGDPDDFNEPNEYEYDPADDIYEEEVAVDESYDLNNGYDDINYMKAGDFFPDGADSPVTSHTGPSGARMGDNPEQKKMEITEAHKELVYNYRKFLKESVKK